MARRSRSQRSITIFTNGKKADDAYGLSKIVGRIVQRKDAAQKKAIVSTSRKVSPICKREIARVFKIAPGKLSGKFPTEITGAALRVFGSRRPFSLIVFAGQWGGHHTPGASAEVVNGARVTYPHSFISGGPFANSQKAIRVRVGHARGPLALLYGPSVANMLGRTAQGPAYGSGIIVGDFSGAGAPVRDSVVGQLLDFFTGELMRLYAVEATNG